MVKSTLTIHEKLRYLVKGGDKSIDSVVTASAYRGVSGLEGWGLVRVVCMV